MKKLLIAALILAGASSTSFAQSQNSQVNMPLVEQRANAETDKWANNLNLNTEQKAKLKKINMNVELQKEHISMSGSAASPERSVGLAKYKTMQYKNILTAEQFSKYEKLSAENK